MPVTQRTAPSERLSIIVLAFTVWTFLFTAAIDSAFALPVPAVPFEFGRFRIVYDVLWLTSLPAFILLADAAYGADRPWLRAIRAALLILVAIGAVLVPVLAVVTLLR
jgi:hypothetical protein